MSSKPKYNSPWDSLSLPIWICAIVLLLSAIYFARGLLLPIVVSLFGYLVLRPVVRNVGRLGIPAMLSASVLVGGMVFIAGLGLYTVVDPAKEILNDAPRYTATIKYRMRSIADKVSAINSAKQQVEDIAESDSDGRILDEPVAVEIKQKSLSSNLFLLSGTGNVISFATIVLVLLFFLLATDDQVLRNIMSAMPDFSTRRQLLTVLDSVEAGLSNYLATVSAINIALGITVTCATWGLGLAYPVMWGVAAALFNFIPILGALSGALLILLVSIVQFDSLGYAFVVTGVYLCLTTIEGQFITPAILGRSMNLSPVMVMLSLVFWGWMWGILGVFLAVPILIAMKFVTQQTNSAHGVAAVLGCDEASVNAREDANALTVPS